MSETENTLLSRLRRSRAARFAVELAFFVALVLGIGAFQARKLPTGAPPPIQLSTLGGGALTNQNLVGKPTMLVVWAPWCGVCGAESDNVDRVAGIVGARANVVTVATGYATTGGEESVRAFVRKHGVESAVGLDADNALAGAFGVRSFPTTFFLDEAGHIDHAVVGYTSTISMLARLWWAS